VDIVGEAMNEYKFIDLRDLNEKIEDGKYLSYGTVLDFVDNEVVFEENPNIRFLSIFKLNKGEFVRFFFSKDKYSFTIDLINKIKDKKSFLEFLEKFKKIKI
jgi:tRNA A37 threonylcarbamoyladenosine dehydratase